MCLGFLKSYFSSERAKEKKFIKLYTSSKIQVVSRKKKKCF